MVASKNMLRIRSGKGLLPDRTKPLPDPLLTYRHQCGAMAFTGEQFHQEYLNDSVTKHWKAFEYYVFCPPHAKRPVS